MNRLSDTVLQPKMIKGRISTMGKVKNLTQQTLAGLHVQLDTEDPTVKIFVLPDGLPLDVKTLFPIEVEQGYARFRGIFNPQDRQYAFTGAKDIEQINEKIMAQVVELYGLITNAKTGQRTNRLHLVGNLETVKYFVNGKWLTPENTAGHVRFVDYNPKNNTCYGIRRVNGFYHEFVKFDLRNKDIKDIVYGPAWDTVAFTPKGLEFVDGSKVTYHEKDRHITVALTFKDAENTTQVLTAIDNGAAHMWSEPVEYGIIGTHFITGTKFAVITRENSNKAFGYIPAEIVANMQVQRYVTPTTGQPQLTLAEQNYQNDIANHPANR